MKRAGATPVTTESSFMSLSGSLLKQCGSLLCSVFIYCSIFDLLGPVRVLQQIN